MNKLRVMIADNSPSVRQFIKYALEGHFPGIITEMANTGKNVQQRLDSVHFDLLIYEKEMPMLDGIELLEWVRSHERLKAMPFILISPDSSEDSLKKAIQLGADAYLLKPFKADNLVQKVASIVNRLERKRPERYSAEGEVLLKTNSHSCRSGLIEISADGFSCVLEGNDSFSHIFEKIEADIRPLNKKGVAGVPGFITRLEEIETESGHNQVRVAVRFIDDLGASKKKELADLLSSLTH